MNDATEAERRQDRQYQRQLDVSPSAPNLILPAHEGRTLDRDFIVHPNQIKTLRRGEAAVITLHRLLGQRCVEITRVRTPRMA